MNAIRVTSFFRPPDDRSGTPESFHALTIVVLERDLREDKSIADATMGQIETTDLAGVFTVAETFDVADDAELESTSIEAARRAAERDEAERYMACLYYYEASALQFAAQGAVMMGTIPAPLGVADVSYALRRLAAHPDYRSQTVIMPSMDGSLVTLREGEIVVA